MKLRDVRRLADTRAAFEFEIPLGKLPDMPPECGAGDGQVQAQVRFGREQGFAVADVELRARLQVICQRCMAPMALTLEAHSTVLVVDSEREADEAPAGWETFLAPEGRLSLAALVAEELRLAVPIVPLHADPAVCGTAVPASAAPEETVTAGAKLRPFAELRALLGQRDGETDT